MLSKTEENYAVIIVSAQNTLASERFPLYQYPKDTFLGGVPAQGVCAKNVLPS